MPSQHNVWKPWWDRLNKTTLELYIVALNAAYVHDFKSHLSSFIFYVLLPSAEQDETEGVSVSLDKVLNCVASSITVAFLQDIINQRKNILEIILNSLSPEESWQSMYLVCKIYYNSMQLFLYLTYLIHHHYHWCFFYGFLCAVKLSSFLCIKELCYKFQNSDGNNTWPEETTYLVEEVHHIVV